MLKDKIDREPRVGSRVASRRIPRHNNEKPYEPEVVYATMPADGIVDEYMGNRMEPKTAPASTTTSSLTQLFEIYERAWNNGTLKPSTSEKKHRHFEESLERLRSNVAKMKADSTSKEQVKGNALNVGS